MSQYNKVNSKSLNQLIKMGIGDWGLGPIPNPQSPHNYKIYNIT